MPGVRFLAEGRVQGVGFRDYVRRVALKTGVSGWVRNLPDGRVEGVSCGTDEALLLFLDQVRKGPPGSRVTGFQTVDVPECNAGAGFRICF